MSKTWAVTVEADGERLVTIESSMLSGKAELTPDDEETIRTAARHLLSFVGERDQGSLSMEPGPMSEGFARRYREPWS